MKSGVKAGALSIFNFHCRQQYSLWPVFWYIINERATELAVRVEAASARGTGWNTPQRVP